jgi:hypothetical protein
VENTDVPSDCISSRNTFSWGTDLEVMVYNKNTVVPNNNNRMRKMVLIWAELPAFWQVLQWHLCQSSDWLYTFLQKNGPESKILVTFVCDGTLIPPPPPPKNKRGQVPSYCVSVILVTRRRPPPSKFLTTHSWLYYHLILCYKTSSWNSVVKCGNHQY